MLLAAAILVFAPLVIVPLGLAQLEEVGRSVPQLWTWIRKLQLPSALIFCIAFFLPQGGVAAALCLPWLLLTASLALAGLIYGLKRVRTLDPKLLRASALVFIPVGAMWALISRWGFPPTPFTDEIVLLTGVHFHYAGFALLVIASGVVQAKPRWYERLLVVGLVSGIPLLAMGITFSPLLEVVAALVIASSCWLLAALMFWRTDANSASAGLKQISAMSIATGMVLAILYAVGEFTGHRWIDIPMMIPLHGLANSIGFAFSGLMAQYIARSSVLAAAVADST